MNIPAMKQSLRQSIIATRSDIVIEERQRLDTIIAARLAKLETYQAAETVLGYMNFGAEFASDMFVRQALQDGKHVLLPKVNKSTRQLDLYQVTDLALDVAPGLWDIREPIIDRCQRIDDLAAVDFILMPGVAFAIDGSRLGYGGGFYDKLLARMTHRPTLVAAAFALQLVDAIPQESTDRKVEWLVTEKEMIHCVN